MCDHDEYDPDNDEVDVDAAPAVICPMCGGIGWVLGVLGRMWHYRCRDCGGDFHDLRTTR